MLRIFFWLLLGVILAISIMPSEDAPTVFTNDKLNHILAFFVLSFMARLLWPRVNSAILFSMLAVFGGSIEILQLVLETGRDADWMDFAADVLAIIFGLLSAQMLINTLGKNSVNE